MELKGLSLFSNVGIAEILLHKLKIEILVANEIEKKRVRFFKEKYPNVEMIEGNIIKNNIKRKIIKSSLEKKINFIISTPPCQGMSTAGKQSSEDPRNQLIVQTIDVIKKIKPLFIFLENVPQQLRTYVKFNNSTVLIPDLLEIQLNNEYNFNVNRIFDMAKYGIPQRRQRSIFLLVRKDLDFRWELNEPKRNKIKTLNDIIGNLPSLDPLIYDIPYAKHLKIFPKYEKKLKIAKKISIWHSPPKHPYRQVIVMQNTPSGLSAFANKNPTYKPRKKNGSLVKGFKNTYKRQSWNAPGYTITTYNRTIGSQENVHPGRLYYYKGKKLYSDPRVLTVFEIMRVMTIPDNWKIPNWCSESFVRQVIGEGIPPKMVYIIFKKLLVMCNTIKH